MPTYTASQQENPALSHPQTLRKLQTVATGDPNQVPDYPHRQPHRPHDRLCSPLQTSNREPVFFVLLVPKSKLPPPITETTTTESCEEWTAVQTLKAHQSAKPQQQQADKPTPTNSDLKPTSESDAADDDNNDAPPTTPDAETPALHPNSLTQNQTRTLLHPLKQTPTQ